MANFETYKLKIFNVESEDARIRIENDFAKYATYSAGDVLPPGKNIGDLKRIAKLMNPLIFRWTHNGLI